MNWTTEIPKVPGYYWFRHPQLGAAMATVSMQDIPDNHGEALHMASDLGYGWVVQYCDCKVPRGFKPVPTGNEDAR